MDLKLKLLIDKCAKASGYSKWSGYPGINSYSVYMDIPSTKDPDLFENDPLEIFSFSNAENILVNALKTNPFPTAATLNLGCHVTRHGDASARITITATTLDDLESSIHHLTGPLITAFQEAIHNIVMDSSPIYCEIDFLDLHTELSNADADICQELAMFTLSPQIIERLSDEPEDLENRLEMRRQVMGVEAIIKPVFDRHTSIRGALTDPDLKSVIKKCLIKIVPALETP